MTNPELPSRNYDDSIERDSPAVEQGIHSYYDDEAARTGVWPDQPNLRSAVPAETLPRKSRPSHRGGRSYPEPSDSELDPEMQSTNEPLSKEQVAANYAGIARLRRMLWIEKAEEIHKSSGGNLSFEQARLRAAFERRRRSRKE